MKGKLYRRAGFSGGFTIIEIIVVLVIIGILATLIAPQVMDRPDYARTVKARSDIENISTVLKIYRLDNGFYPTTEQGLQALVSQPTTEPVPMSWKPNGYIDGGVVPKDPWGRDYIYRCPSDPAEFEIISLGSDGEEGGTEYAEDISSTRTE